MKTFELKNKIALVTGSNRGIGEAYVRGLIDAGVSKVYAAARDITKLQPMIEEYGNLVVPVELDVTREEQVSALADKIDQLDILINNAGIINACFSTDENALEIARSEMETNFFGPMRVTQALLSRLKQSTEAAIINVSSIAGISNFPAIGPYSTTKAAFHSYTQGLRADLAVDGIKVIGVYPGPIDTRMTEGWEMEKPQPSQVAEKTFEALLEGKVDVLPDDFSEQMYAAFLSDPHELEKAFAEMQ